MGGGWEILGWVVLALVLFHFLDGGKRDDTDSASERSGLRLYTDNKTGVQYVGTAFGGLSPRLDEKGKPLVVTVK